ncbi:MAG: hypothetical protein Q9M15_03295 [Mariprofundaceae bacterium]|nr:hypothetical protein [Mariprofundaceae bacterium]
MALILPVLCWPLAPYLGLEPIWGTSFEKNWLISASLLLIVFTVSDAVLAERYGVADLVMNIAWVLFSCYMVIFVLQHLSAAWFLAATLGLRALSITPLLWQQTHQPWWYWQAWWRDSSTALMMFTWLIYW